MPGYTKLFSSILASSIWSESWQVRIVWITMLAMADRDGLVEAAEPGLADLARVPLADCLDALEKLSQPDKYSRSPEQEGRRIVKVQGGWQIVNYLAYREKDPVEEIRAKTAERVKRYRERHTPHSNVTVTPGNVTVTPCNPIAESIEQKGIEQSAGARAPLPPALPESGKGCPQDPGDMGADPVPAEDSLVAAFDFCKTPGVAAKRDAIGDLLRQGASVAAIAQYAANPKYRKWDFYRIVKQITRDLAKTHEPAEPNLLAEALKGYVDRYALEHPEAVKQ